MLNQLQRHKGQSNNIFELMAGFHAHTVYLFTVCIYGPSHSMVKSKLRTMMTSNNKETTKPSKLLYLLHLRTDENEQSHQVHPHRQHPSGTIVHFSAFH